jgi:propionyl-CoA carboxylase alpha chain
VEILVLGDQHCNLVHLGERECSIQRRHQKIIEESPSPRIDASTREAMGEAALRLAAAIGYCSAGTVEFVVDDDDGSFAFLEANTRLQVEHPVTEAVTGIDLVRAQLLIAMGEPLAISQGDIGWNGHAIEARLYAEDPASGFLPATGTIQAFTPRFLAGVRWDAGIGVGSVVTTDFDPMLAKVIAHAPGRREAADRLAAELEDSHIGGVRTNLAFLVDVLRHPAFLAGDTTTDFIERVQPSRVEALGDEDRARVGAVAALWLQGANRAAAETWASLPSGWRNAKLPPQRVELVIADGDPQVIEYERRRDGSFALAGGATALVHEWTPDGIDLELDGRRASWSVVRTEEELSVHGPTGTVAVRHVPRFADPNDVEVQGGFSAPMPGKVVEVRVADGDRVTAGATLLILEAMKMEHHVTAPADGLVQEVLVAVGSQVETGATLLVFVVDEPVETTT